MKSEPKYTGQWPIWSGHLRPGLVSQTQNTHVVKAIHVMIDHEPGTYSLHSDVTVGSETLQSFVQIRWDGNLTN